MAHANRVVRSIETDDGGRCVDLFAHPDGSFGFEGYRRDTDDGRGWFETADGALKDALTKVAWLREVVERN